jgi:prepilin-type processing-associated H-X9-DG protein
MNPATPESDRDKPQPLDYANPQNRPLKPARRFVEVAFSALGFIVFLGIVATMFLPARNHEPNTSPRLQSASHLRQIGQAILLYSNDHQGEYPDSFQTILLNEDITSAVFVSPTRSETPANGPTTQAIADRLAAGGHLSYVYLGRQLAASSATPATIVAYEIPIDGGNVLFGDGHVEFEDAAYMSKVISRAAIGQFPVTMPTN